VQGGYLRGKTGRGMPEPAKDWVFEGKTEEGKGLPPRSPKGKEINLGQGKAERVRLRRSAKKSEKAKRKEKGRRACPNPGVKT